MNTARKLSLLVLIVVLTVIASSAAPLLGERTSTPSQNADAYGPACCRYSNECPGSETCGSTTGCSAGAPYHCSGAAESE